MGPVIYTAIFIVRPLFLNPSIALFMAGGLAFGPVVGSVYTSVGAPLSGTVGFWFSRKMGNGVLNNTQFSFPVVFLLILILVMSVTVINYGACLSQYEFCDYISAHVMGMTPRAFAYGFFGSTLLEIGSIQFHVALTILIICSALTVLVRWQTRNATAKEKTGE